MKQRKSTALRLFSLVGLAVLLAGTAFAPASQAQSAAVPPAPVPPAAVPPTPTQIAAAACAAGGIDVCFPTLTSGAPNAACSATEEGAGVVTECLAQVCRSAAAEPEPGFFAYCCARGGSVQYDDFCAFAVQSACPAVAEHCADRCPPVQLLTGTVTLAPPLPACIATYPAFIARVCAQDEFCCSTSWDAICAQAAVSARSAALFAAGSAVLSTVVATPAAALPPAALPPAALPPATPPAATATAP
ncbi:MAG: hypothetical protein RL685_2247 [Pseudomonadota bacterium]